MSGLDTVIGGKAGNPEAVKKHVAEAVRLEKARDRDGAVQQYRAARELSDDQSITFNLAYLLDLGGEENEAVALYTELTNNKKPHVNALVNLAVICEDRGEFLRAERLLIQVVDTDPNHSRARLFLKDVQASKHMQVESEGGPIGLGNAILDTPVTDFELSVRARKALQLLNIGSIGELASRTEAELMGVKNFGATSLHEIRERLQQHGLSLRQLS